MALKNEKLIFAGNEISTAGRRTAKLWTAFLTRRYHYDPNESYQMSAVPNEVMGPIFGVKNVVAGNHGEPFDTKKGVMLGTLMMGYGHYRMSMAIASAAHAMGFTPYWHDLFSFEESFTAKSLRFVEKIYNFQSRMCQHSKLYNKYIWEPKAEKELRPIEWGATAFYVNQFFTGVYTGIPKDIPYISSYGYSSNAAYHAGMKNIVHQVADNFPISHYMVHDAIHAVQSPSCYYGYRTMRKFGKNDKNLNPLPAEKISFTGSFVDHEIVQNVEKDSQRRLDRMKSKEPRRILLTIGGAGTQAELFNAILKHLLPKVKKNQVALLVNCGDHPAALAKLQKTIDAYGTLATKYDDYKKSFAFAHDALDKKVSGLHYFISTDRYAAVYLTNLLMRATDIMMTKPSELSFYPVPKIFLAHVGGHEIGGSYRSSELGDGTMECTTWNETVMAMDIMTNENDVLEHYCDMIVRNNSIGLYDGAYNCITLATGKKWQGNAAQ